jgi:hypothetical protein
MNTLSRVTLRDNHGIVQLVGYYQQARFKTTYFLLYKPGFLPFTVATWLHANRARLIAWGCVVVTISPLARIRERNTGQCDRLPKGKGPNGQSALHSAR